MRCQINPVLASIVCCLFAFWIGGCDPEPEQPGLRAMSASGDGPTSRPSMNAKVVFIPKSAGNSYFDPVSEGIRKACLEMGAEYSLNAPPNAEATSQLSIIQDQVNAGVKAIVIAPNSSTALNDALQKAIDKGVLVITVDSDLTGAEKLRAASVLPARPETIGETQIELMSSLLNGKGKFAILSATMQAPNQNSWIAAMKKTLERPEYKDLQLVDIVYGDDNPQKSAEVCQQLLQKYPDLNGILSPTTIGVAAAAEVVKKAGKSDSIKVTGLGLPNEMRAFIKDGSVNAFSLWTPYDMGYLAGCTACRILAGELKPATGVKVDANNMGPRTFDEKNTIYVGYTVTFSRSNIDMYRY